MDDQPSGRYGSFLVIEQRLGELRDDVKDLRAEIRADNAARDARLEATFAGHRAEVARIRDDVDRLKTAQVALSANLKLVGGIFAASLTIAGLLLKLLTGG